VDAERLLKELVGVAHGVGVDVRIEHMRTAANYASGGLCRLRGKTVVVLNAKSPAVDRVLTLAEAIAPLTRQTDGEIGPEAREVLDAAMAKREGRMPIQESRAAAVRVMARPKPGVKSCRRPAR